MSFVDAPFGFRFGEGLDVGCTIDVGGIHDVHGIGIRDEEDRDQNVNYEIHGSHIVIMYDDPIGRLLFGLMFLFLDPFRNWTRFEFHWRDYKPALKAGSREL